MKQLVLLILLPVLLAGSCKKDDGLTDPTQTGANTFSCKIDGVIFKPSESGGLFGGDPLFVRNSSVDGFTLQASKYGDATTPHERVLIKLSYLKTTGIYQLNTFPGYGQFTKEFSNPYRTNSTHTGTVNISYCDTVNHIYSGTFFFTTVDNNTGKILKITDGRFDVKR